MPLRPHGDTENGLNLDEERIPYHQLSTVLSEAVAEFAHLYGYGESKFKLLSQMLGSPVHNLEDLKCPSPSHFTHKNSFNNRVTEIPLSTAQLDMLIPYTNG
jgi:hypothetical protein